MIKGFWIILFIWISITTELLMRARTCDVRPYRTLAYETLQGYSSIFACLISMSLGLGSVYRI